jgi:hypothetical protein
MITIFGDFRPFSAKILFFLQNVFLRKRASLGLALQVLKQRFL